MKNIISRNKVLHSTEFIRLRRGSCEHRKNGSHLGLLNNCQLIKRGYFHRVNFAAFLNKLPKFHTRPQVFTNSEIHIEVFWVVALCRLAHRYQLL